MGNPISYLICTTERTGSYLLCDLLASTGIAGRPQECFHPGSLAQLSGKAERPDYAATFERIIREGATPNGVFGAKVQWWQLQQLIRKLRDLPEFHGIGAVELLQHWLPGVRYIRLTRRNKVRQAVSCLKALQTDIWWETDAWVRANRPAPAANPAFDFAALDGLIHQIARHEAAWQLFFDACGAQPLDITYEDLVRDQAATARQVLDYLQVPAPGDLAIGQPRYKKQADGLSEQWVQRYHELKTAPGAGAPSAAAAQVPREDRGIIFSHDAAAERALPIQPRAERGRALRIVSYATQPLGGLPALLARHISEHTPHTAVCVWSSAPQGSPADPHAIDWTADPAAAAGILADADVVLLHDGQAAPQHQALLKDKAVVVLAHHPHARQSGWLGLGAPGAVLNPQLAGQPAFQSWPRMPLPWDSARDWDRLWMPLIARALPPPEPNSRVIHRSAPAPEHGSAPEGGGGSLKIAVYPLVDQPAALRPAAADQAWLKQHSAAAGQLALSTAGGIGWELRCPYACEATWNGGPAPEDIAIRIDAPASSTPPFVQSQLGGGLLSFYPGCQIQAEGPNSLWVRGPINRPKDGLSALEQIVDTTLLPAAIAVTWQCTRPNQTVRFERGEPFAVLLPYPQHYADKFETQMVPFESALERYTQEIQQRLQSPAIQDLLQRLQEAEPDAPAAPGEATGRWAAQLGDPPPVSCICPTYGRVALLEEAIESFLRQDYPGEKELIVLNDYPDQTLVFAHPEVRIVNVPRRLHSVGEKYQAAAALCSHDLIVVWHDDDIYLPHRLSLSVAQLDRERGFFKASQAWFWNQGRLSEPQSNRFHGGGCFSRALLAETRGYPHVDNGFDGGFEAACESLHPGATKGQPLAPEDLYYIYRWAGTGSYHLSAAGQNGEAHAAVAAYVREQAEQGRIERGRIALSPHWKADYAALVRDCLADGPAKAAQEGAQAHAPEPPPVTFVDTPEGRVDLQQFGPAFYLAAQSTTRDLQERIRRHGSTQPREFYVVDALRLAYLPIPKSACSSIKIALAKPAGIDYDLDRGIEGIHGHGKWRREIGRLSEAQRGYYRFSFVRNPFERLVSCYRQKILFTPTPEMPHPFYQPYFFALPANTSFADFAERVCRIPDPLSENHFKSQYALLYDAGELLVDYVGKLEQIERDWAPLAERYQLAPLLIQTNVSKHRPGAHSDYRRYYTEPLARMVYERYRQDVESFGYQAEYELLLEFVAEGQPVAVAG
ncbi:MAG: sulfotransferase family 2 domain-containing protein [Kouleothrix sp.]|nr:sulfotransferase family 2 domain-containing protein [Kouleothrix sp.]